MASPAQMRANRANSANSTGPKTEKGLAASSGNSLRHGLTASQLIIGQEKKEDYEALLADLTSSHQPANAAECILVGQIAENYWRLLRARGVETGNWEKRIELDEKEFIPNGPNRQLARIFTDNEGGLFERLMRYEASIERSYYRAIKQLEHLQLTRKKEEKSIGFVSQKPVAAASPEPPQVAAFLRIPTSDAEAAPFHVASAVGMVGSSGKPDPKGTVLQF